jgi:DNA-binding GntR family transcriptional regulator
MMIKQQKSSNKTEAPRPSIDQKTVLPGRMAGGIQQGRGFFEPQHPMQKPALPAPQKQNLQRLKMSHMPSTIKAFNSNESKDAQIAQWLQVFIQKGLERGTLNVQHLLPLKQELAKYLRVSVGTVQNAIRQLEDAGWVESKQRIGTLLRNPSEAGETHRVRKQTSKRDQAVLAVQHYILSQNMQAGDMMPASRDMAQHLNSAPNTIRLAMEALTSEGILESHGNRGKRSNWMVKRLPEASEAVEVASITLIDQLERDLKTLIANEMEVNHRLPSHQELATSFSVSIKTVHDAMQRLVEQGIVHSKRGRYGSFVSRLPMMLQPTQLQEFEALFKPAAQHTAFYNYEHAYAAVKRIIETQGLQPGDKLPNVQKMAQLAGMNESPIRKALQLLKDEGKVRFTRGRNGGAFLI